MCLSWSPTLPSLTGSTRCRSDGTVGGVDAATVTRWEKITARTPSPGSVNVISPHLERHDVTWHVNMFSETETSSSVWSRSFLCESGETGWRCLCFCLQRHQQVQLRNTSLQQQNCMNWINVPGYADDTQLFIYETKENRTVSQTSVSSWRPNWGDCVWSGTPQEQISWSHYDLWRLISSASSLSVRYSGVTFDLNFYIKDWLWCCYKAPPAFALPGCAVVIQEV